MIADSIIHRATWRQTKTIERYMKEYSVEIITSTDQGIRGYVTNPSGKSYGVVLKNGTATCSCEDAMYRGNTCKHALFLAHEVLKSSKQAAKEKKIEQLEAQLKQLANEIRALKS